MTRKERANDRSRGLVSRGWFVPVIVAFLWTVGVAASVAWNIPGTRPVLLPPYDAVVGEDPRARILGRLGVWTAGMAFLGIGAALLIGREKERVNATALLKAERDRIKAVFAATPDMMAQKDRRSVYEVVNPAFCDFVGKREDAILGMTDFDLFPEPAAGRYRKDDETVMASGRVQVREELVESREGPRWLHVTKTPLRDATGAVTGVLCSCRDIHERTRAEESAQGEMLLRNLLLDNLPCIALVMKKRTREIVACNEIAKKYGAVVGNTCFDTLAVPGTPCPFCRAPELWETGESRQIESEYMGKFWRGHWVPFSDDLYVHYIFDITDRKRAEAEKEKLQGQLQQAMKMEAVGRLAGGVAHDFNNLLTVIIGNVSLAHMKLSPFDPAAGILLEANKAADRAATLTQQLLAFSRKQIIEPKVVDLNDVIEDLHAMLVRLIREDIEIRILPGERLGSVKVDAGQFQQVLVNLVVNARDAMPDGGKILIETSNADLDDAYCSVHPYVKPGRFVMVAVSDSGTGMSDEVKGHVFEPFFTTKAKGTGTGLGLATTYGAVKQAGGSIEVYTEIGKGTTFKVYLPRVEDGASRKKGEDRPAVLAGGTEKVLVVEDEENIRALCVRILEPLGYEVMQASNGREAIAAAKDHGERIDLLMTDVVMPGMNGRELAERVRDLHPETKVLFASGYTENAVVHHGVLNAGVAFIGKPYSPSALAKKIREVLDSE